MSSSVQTSWPEIRNLDECWYPDPIVVGDVAGGKRSAMAHEGMRGANRWTSCGRQVGRVDEESSWNPS